MGYLLQRAKDVSEISWEQLSKENKRLALENFKLKHELQGLRQQP